MNEIIRPGHFGCKGVAQNLSKNSLSARAAGRNSARFCRFLNPAVAVPCAECDFLFIGNDIMRSEAAHTAKHRIANCLQRGK